VAKCVEIGVRRRRGRWRSVWCLAARQLGSHVEKKTEGIVNQTNKTIITIIDKV